MSDTRKDRVQNPEQSSMLDFTEITTDILYPIVAAADTNNNLNSSAATEEMARYAITCKSMRTFFQPQLDYRGAKILLVQVLQVNEDNKAKILERAKTNPRLFFIKATAQDYAMDLEGNVRTIKDWSPYQALFGTGDKELLADVKPYLDAYLDTLTGEIVFNNVKYKNGKDLAIQQQKEKFPNGFDFPPCTDEFIRIVGELAKAVTNDLQLKQDWKKPNLTTFNLLLEFRKHQIPGIVETGHHYNMNDVIKTHEIYELNWEPWSGNQLTFWGVFIIGLQERLMTSPYLAVACIGLDNHVNKNQPLNRRFEVKNYVTNKMIMVLPLPAEDPTCRLGVGFVINSHYGGGRRWLGVGCGLARPALENYVKQTQQGFQRLCTDQRDWSFSCVIA